MEGHPGGEPSAPQWNGMRAKMQAGAGWILEQMREVPGQVYKEEQKTSNLESSERVSGRNTSILNAQRNAGQWCTNVPQLPADSCKAY